MVTGRLGGSLDIFRQIRARWRSLLGLRALRAGSVAMTLTVTALRNAKPRFCFCFCLVSNHALCVANHALRLLRFQPLLSLAPTLRTFGTARIFLPVLDEVQHHVSTVNANQAPAVELA